MTAGFMACCKEKPAVIDRRYSRNARVVRSLAVFSPEVLGRVAWLGKFIEHASDLLGQLPGRVGLLQKTRRSLPGKPARNFHFAKTARKNYGNIRADGLKPLQYFLTGHSRHRQVQQNQRYLRGTLAEPQDAFRAVFGEDHRVSQSLQSSPGGAPHHFLVIDDQNRFAASGGLFIARQRRAGAFTRARRNQNLEAVPRPPR